MKMERKFFCKIKGEGCSHWPSVIVQMVQRNSAIFECYLSFRQYFYAPYGPFCSSSFDVRAWACNPNALFNGLVRNRVTDQHRQAITGKLCVFNKKWHRTCAVVTYNEKQPSKMPQNPLKMWKSEVTWPMKNKIYPLLRDLWSQNLAGYWLMMRGTHPSGKLKA